ncbi:rifin PIR protein, putative [Plasmodium sp. gorilla clade G2]|uniref:rifin PIR protein, putative n=1 Tax=Plasmodium sp. gorilla clade G2 TaxID=880535 RepID=UPI000D2043FD|nr:rifin PIR protein, putative [Plasmodium sp. gorilla clade G2]SOV11139.1 rifin PIR protein, putative [Plasmodium sp. gorilla clade G2]
MKHLCFNILLLYCVVLVLFLLFSQVNDQKNYYSTRYTQKSKPTTNITIRLLCEYESYDLYKPTYYVGDSEMKELMDKYHRQTAERFKEYDERMQQRRKICKEQCEKEIQKIILKDKIEKGLTEKLSALNTNITTEDIPTCVCDKSVADKVEKTCLKCGWILGGGVAPELGLLGGTALYAISVWKPKAIAAAAVLAAKKGAIVGKATGIEAGVQEVIKSLYHKFGVDQLGASQLQTIVTSQNFNNFNTISGPFKVHYSINCVGPSAQADSTSLCLFKDSFPEVSEALKAIEGNVKTIVTKAMKTVETTTQTETTKLTSEFTAQKTAEITAFSTTYNTAIVASIIAIVVIVLVMVIIYLILRYRRKKKMKKKLQYIKLLKE